MAVAMRTSRPGETGGAVSSELPPAINELTAVDEATAISPPPVPTDADADVETAAVLPLPLPVDDSASDGGGEIQSAQDDEADDSLLSNTSKQSDPAELLDLLGPSKWVPLFDRELSF